MTFPCSLPALQQFVTHFILFPLFYFALFLQMKAFSDFDFPPVIKQNIELCKYVNPTPIQKFALPVAFLGRDVMACAQTGSGVSVYTRHLCTYISMMRFVE
jgi:hypothetical protein